MKRYKADIAVVGGGVAGFAAALSAVEKGRNVVVIEKEDRPGGNAIQSNVGTICGAYYNSASEKPERIDHPMIHKVLDALASEPIHYQGLYVVPYDLGGFHQFIQQQLDQDNLDVLLNTAVTSVNMETSTMQELVVQGPDTNSIIEASAFIDSSGNGILSSLAGLEMLQSESYQAASQVFRVDNVFSENEFSLNFALRKVMVELIQKKELPNELGSLSAVPGSLHDGNIDLKFTIPMKITDSINRNELDSMGTDYARRILDYLTSRLDSFSKAAMKEIYPHAGIRILQRSKGKYVLTENDVLEGKKNKSSAAIGTWPIEEWDHFGKVHLTLLPENDYYEIPTNCLMSYGVENLFLAGKNISATEKAIGSARVIGTCLQTGYAAGQLASDLSGN